MLLQCVFCVENNHNDDCLTPFREVSIIVAIRLKDREPNGQPIIHRMKDDCRCGSETPRQLAMPDWKPSILE